MISTLAGVLPGGDQTLSGYRRNFEAAVAQCGKAPSGHRDESAHPAFRNSLYLFGFRKQKVPVGSDGMIEGQ